MPTFHVVSKEEAFLKSGTGVRARIAREYLEYVDKLQDNQAGRLQLEEGETPTMVKRRLNYAAKLAGKSLVVKRAGADLYFWAQPPKAEGAPRRGRRPRKA